jgi:hypothetical protein
LKGLDENLVPFFVIAFVDMLNAGLHGFFAGMRKSLKVLLQKNKIVQLLNASCVCRLP